MRFASLCVRIYLWLELVRFYNLNLINLSIRILQQLQMVDFSFFYYPVLHNVQQNV
nr:MAG TPA: hypothetical protein [Bacteriophage sp.]